MEFSFVEALFSFQEESFVTCARHPCRRESAQRFRARAGRIAIRLSVTRSERAIQWRGGTPYNKALGLSMIAKTYIKACEGLFASRPRIYIWIILVAIIASCSYELRTQAIFACQATLYNSDRYIAYCDGTSYGDYEHGAFWFDLEPSAQNSASNAEVLFLGNSRIQFALSTAVTADWFSAASARYYLLGFTFNEGVSFAEALLHRIRPKAKVYVINVDDFFNRWESPPAKAVMHDPESRTR